jgi:peptide/nickel transport system ATP-binding protein
LTDTDRILRRYPFQLSGGMNQRVAIAYSLIAEPRILFADEPTSALDVTTQAEVVAVLLDAFKAHLDGMVFITHDILLASDICHRLVVMKDGEVVEEGAAAQVLDAPREDYTRALIEAVPGIGPASLPSAAPTRSELPAHGDVLQLRGITVEYGDGRRKAVRHRAVADASISVAAGECVGIVGESGSGKSTLARVILGLQEPMAGQRELFGTVVAQGSRDPRVQAVFQNAYASLDPMQRIGAGFRELRKIAADQVREDVPSDDELLDMVDLTADVLGKRPRELSGGQCQRVSIARALLFRPRLLVADEPTSALDVRVQHQILQLLRRLNETQRTSVLFISHNLLVVRELCARVYVMCKGEIVERGETSRVLAAPEHEYTARLVSSIPGGGALALTAQRLGDPS